jgi:hypothetical protein
MSDPMSFSKKNKRKISGFVGAELIYDYIDRKLDPERMVAMDQLVHENRDIQNEIHSITASLTYVEHLAETEVTLGLLQKTRDATGFYLGLLKKLRIDEWPSGIKLGLEVMLVTSFLAVGAVFLPWHRIVQMAIRSNKDAVIAEIPRGKNQESAESIATGNAKELLEKNDSEVFEDEKEKPTATPAVKAVAVVPEKPKSPGNPSDQPQETSEGKDSVKANVKHQGYLYRGNMAVVNVTATSEKFIAKISELGGRKAGEVDLGWKKGDGAYFHFTMPESKYDELTKYLQEYGKLKIQKLKHDRLMPEGIIRIIIDVNEEEKQTQ